VVVYRLIQINTIEDRIINLQYKKLKLDHLVCNDMQSNLLKRREAVKLISTNIEELIYSKPSGTGSP
jgi:SNF2 family DNA or RNA helicase